jgi:hypothetical protein
MPEATFFVFLFHSPCFYPFTTNVTRALPLEAIKGEAGSTPSLTRDLGFALSLESL